jgi:ribonucleoside-diphosphate reductase alpha chain
MAFNYYDNYEMYVTKRSGELEPIAFDKIKERLMRLIHLYPNAPLTKVNCSGLVIKIVDQLKDKITTTEIDELTAQQCASMAMIHPDYGDLAGRILVSNHHKNTESSFRKVTDALYYNVDSATGRPAPLISETYYNMVKQIDAKLSESKLGESTYTIDGLTGIHVYSPGTPDKTFVPFNTLDAMINYDRDYLFDFFGFKTLEKAYLLKNVNGHTEVKRIIERPQHLWMRVAIAIHGENIAKVLETYTYFSTKMFIHATPTLFNAGTNFQQLSSCFLLQMESDSIKGIYSTLSDCAQISQYAGGIGLSVHNIRAAGSLIRGTGGTSNGLVPMLRVFESTALYVDQGGGKRNGSFAIYLEPWHADIEQFLQMRMNHGVEKHKARDLFYALWMPDLFMRRLEEGKPWTLMCPDVCPGLSDVYGEEFEQLYERYEREGRGNATVSIEELWKKILDAHMETGTPYILYKDTINRTSNQSHLGTIKSSNLCAEITEFTSPEETAVCNLASVALPVCVDTIESADGSKKQVFNFEKLAHLSGVLTENLDRVIDCNFYPTEKTSRSNMKHRPLGQGVQGLADVFVMMDMPYTSPDALLLNNQIFETYYFGSISKSADLAVTKGMYESFPGSPTSRGLLQFDLHGRQPDPNLNYDWTSLKQKIVKTGLRNSLSIALMPTASTSQILGYNECFEPITSNIFSRSTLAGTYLIVNKYLIRELVDMGVWSEAVQHNIIANNGSVSKISEVIPNSAAIQSQLRKFCEKYRTVWEMPQRVLIDLAVGRGAFVCQSQSMNLFVADPSYKVLTAMFIYGWKKGLKTGMYYLRRLPRYISQQFIVEPTKNNGTTVNCTTVNGTTNNNSNTSSISVPSSATTDIKETYTEPEACEFCSA